jgi:hypothetical protein
MTAARFAARFMATLTWAAALVAVMAATLDAEAAARAILAAGLAIAGAALLSTLGQRSEMWNTEPQRLQFFVLQRGGI